MNLQSEMKTEEDLEEKPGTKISLSENTPVRLGLVVVVFSAIVGAIVWNATNYTKLNAKLDNLTTMLARVANTSDTNERRVSDHIADDRRMWTEVESRLAVVERSGSEKTRELEKELNILRRDFEVHRALAPIVDRPK